MEDTLINMDRQTDKYEAIWRLRDYANAYKIHVWYAKRKTDKAIFQLRMNQRRQEEKSVCYLPLRVPKCICTCQ